MSDASSRPPEVQHNATKPPGVLARNTQSRLLAGVALLMVAVIALSGRNSPKERKSVQPVAPVPIDPNQARIDEYRKRIEEQTKKLAAEQAELTQTKQALGLSNRTTGITVEAGSGNGVAGQANSRANAGTAVLTRSWIALDREKREYESLYTSNVALTYREGSGNMPFRQPDVARAGGDANKWDHPAAPRAGSHTGDGARPETTVANGAASDHTAINGDSNRATGKLYKVFEGSILESVLTNRLDGSFSGPVNCMVTTPLYSHDRQRVLVPTGSRLLGEVKSVESLGQQRLALTFHRLIMPDGYFVGLDQFQGLNQVGETGLRDQVNYHYLRIFGVSLAIGAIAGLSQTNTRYGFNVPAEDAYRQGVANSLSQSSLRILDRFLNVLPTFTIREGHRIKVYLSGDLLLPAYENHQMPGDL